MDTDASRNLTREETLGLIQQKTLGVNVPSVAYLAFVCLLGLIGNSLVLFVYSRRFTRSPTRVFILAIAGFDLIANLLVIPGEMYTLLHWWEKGSDLFCKILMYLGAQSFIVAALLLVAVAYARFSKSIKGDKQHLKLRDVRQICIVLVVASLVFSIPYAVVNQCGADDAYPPVLSPAIAAFLIILFAVCVVPLAVLYSRVCCKVWRRRRLCAMGVDKPGTTHRDGKEAVEDTRGGSLPVVTSRSRSYIKRKPEDSSEQHVQDKVSDGGGVQAEDNVIELVEEDKPEDGDARLCEARMIRSPTGDKVTVNLSMVRELTVKLKAVQKQAEERLAKCGEQTEDVPKDTSENNNEVPMKSDETGGKKSPNDDIATKTQQEETSKNDLNDNPEKETNQYEKQQELNKGVNAGLTDGHSPSMNQNDEQKLTTEENVVTALKQASNSDKKQPHQAEDEGVTSENDIGESSEMEVTVRKGERVNAEITKEADDMQESSLYIPSDFAKAMQWVEITYCQRTDPRPSDADDDSVDPASLMKKGSFMSSRKVSRDNSFLRKHRKLRDALTDTLTRARKSKKDRDERNGSCTDVSDKQNDRISEDVNDTDSLNVIDTSTDSEVPSRLRKEAAANENCDVSSGIRTAIPEDCPRESEQDQRGSRRGLDVTTRMLLIVSLIYIISSLPYLALNFIRSQSPGAFIAVDQTGEILYNVFIRAHFLNSAVKPVVYVISNVKFRHHCWKLLKRC